MPMEAQKLMREGENLATVCVDLHTAHNSSFELSADEYNRLRLILQTAVTHWTPPDSSFPEFDNAMLALITTTLNDCDSALL
jgi:hypothetical protein